MTDAAEAVALIRDIDRAGGQYVERVVATSQVLCRHLLDVLADPAVAPPDAIATADALSRLARAAGRPGTALHAAVDSVAQTLAARACESTDHLRRLLDTPDFPDLQTISLDVLRIEGVRWVLEILDRRAALRTVSEHSRRLSRVTLKRSGETIRAFVGKPDLLALYDNMAVVSQVDDLLTVSTRLLDALRDGDEERTAFVAPYDEEALRAFGAVLIDLSTLLWKIAMNAVGRRDVSASVFGATLHQLGALHAFSSRLGAGKPLEFSRLEQSLRQHAIPLAEKVFALASAAPGHADDEADPIWNQARAMGTLLKTMGLDRP